ncbi:putative germin, rmlC-like cupin domain superfamily, rmlC-like jelly roll [Helianthus annuus]|nr:putative germin, rmlC-like cupin domain superfamily, rmlC-like jelly roll [Helianthus annuus]KAJ0767978.1 putative germin, rmlC-like cupin domain superfamily, rmlC-like jelly roll [Helianthus annuus]
MCADSIPNSNTCPAGRNFKSWVCQTLHPRATEILTVLEGTLQVGFVTSNPDNHFITKVLKKGDVFVFPVGLVHFQHNVGNGYAVAIAALSSQKTLVP